MIKNTTENSRDYRLDIDKKNTLIALGRFIRMQRTERNLSAYQIEQKYSVDKSLWSKLENGKLSSIPKPEFLIKISDILGCNCIELYKIVGFLSDNDIQRYMLDSHRVKERDMARKSFKP